MWNAGILLKADILVVCACLVLANIFKMPFWRDVGLNYVQYSQVCARVIRACLKPELRVEAIKRDEKSIRHIKWKDGKAVKNE
ncbi:ATP synthase subunit epsilon-like protein, mitochondrial [Lingula anatina]|uniref:ATP synthase subunit epsilon-like protein, mitochondrial n=1 Tax=Lingula anatina TaxID=7574 RepID=A0A1S3JG30_LINAN|nr:ATP synthase subunit epsilon-like protein, mitochondrial [Lingula anatina]|eukprot:XP_013409357.1 ATP synthase subunit epsilon-like protein, mitochondrial [Lingula anatina]